ncbi:MAG TPA: S8 family serine peptidase [Acidimicrobiales bacterium]|nr:S8 family serine peptidase [Acidimicrobiales bacterium]
MTLGLGIAPVAAMADPGNGNGNDPAVAVIVEPGTSGFATASALVNSVLPPGQAKQVNLDIINGVAVTLPQHFVNLLTSAGGQVLPDEPVSVQDAASSSGPATCPGPTGPSTPSGNFTKDTGADQLAAAGDNGSGATVAVIDTGINSSLPDFGNRVVGGVDLSGGNSPFTDQYGHGTFVAGLIAGDGTASNGAYPGEAPGANLVSVKAAGATGVTSASTIVKAIQWVTQNRNKYKITGLNLSFGAVPLGPTSMEPMDQAVEKAWKAGITVVVSAGNAGPFNGTITSPGDDPYVITVGAYDDNNSSAPYDWADCSFSSVGPTAYDGFIKPDISAPGRSVISVLDPGSTIALANPGAVVGTGNFVGSGTSFSAAITSGAAALVQADNPGASPNEIKGRLLGNALPGQLGNPFVEGHGYLNAFYAATGPKLVLNQANGNSGQGQGNLFQNPTVSLGSSWNGSSWNGSSWNGSSWNGMVWDGSSWNGSSWNGSSWNGSSWNGSSWNGSSWNGSSWNGSSWNGSSWNGSSWNGSSWN